MGTQLKALAARSNPEKLALFPIAGAILLPGCDIPLNVFEPRFLNMVDDALKSDRLIGIVQPILEKPAGRQISENAKLHNIGGLGRIIQFAEMDDGRYMIVLRGLKRFAIAEEITSKTPYRIAMPDFSNFAHDIEIHENISKSIEPSGDKEKKSALMAAMKKYAKYLGVGLDWEALAQIPLPHLVDQAAQISPFEPDDKQSLLEAASHAERRRLLIGLMDLYSTGFGSMVQ